MVRSCDVLAVGAHPDDVELGCGGLLARLAAAGRRVGIVDLTAGELGTRGDPTQRRGEAEAAAQALGVAWRTCLGLPDGGLKAEADPQLAAIVGALRVARPRAVLLPDAGDPHPDHQAAALLVARACTWAGVRVGGRISEARTSLACCWPTLDRARLLQPALAIDITAHHEAKRAACAAHRSQFDPAAGPPTHWRPDTSSPLSWGGTGRSGT